MLGPLLVRTLLGAARGLGPCVSARCADEIPLRIGVLTDMSGTSMDTTGPGAVVAVRMAVEEMGGRVLDRPIEVISGDHQLKPDIGSGIARRWYDTEGVELIVDVPVSAVGLAVQAVSREKRKLLVTTGTVTSDFTGKACSPYAMQWVFNTTALANGTVRTILDTGKRDWFFLTADYAFGLALERDASRIVRERGGTVVGNARHPFNTPDLTSFVVSALSSKANVIALANGVPDNVSAIRQIGEFGGLRPDQVVAGLFMSILDVRSAGLNATQGLLLTDAFYWDMDERSRGWSQRFFERFGRMPTSLQAADYSATLHYLKAVRQAGTTDPLAVAAAMRTLPVDDAYARNGHLRKSGLMVHDLLLARVKSPAASRGPWDVYDIVRTIAGADAFPAESEEACPLLGGLP